MTSFFKELLDYSHHYNQKLYDLFAINHDKVSEKSIKLFNHILNAHHIWNKRILLEPQSFAVWEMHELKDLKIIDTTNYQQSIEILNKVDLEKLIDYKTSQGQPFSNSIRHILFHVINHSTHHRAQISAELRQSGLEPLIMDYVFYKRQ